MNKRISGFCLVAVLMAAGSCAFANSHKVEGNHQGDKAHTLNKAHTTKQVVIINPYQPVKHTVSHKKSQPLKHSPVSAQPAYIDVSVIVETMVGRPK
jgi:hypothetical protein